MPTITKTTIHKIMERAIAIDHSFSTECRDFTLMTSALRPDTLLLRWTCIDITDIDRPRQCYHFECFHMDGSPQLCSVNYSNQQEANEFFASLKAHYSQTFALDHRL